MNNLAPEVSMVQVRGSWRGRALKTLVRLILPKPMQQNADIAALRRYYETLDARYFATGAGIAREAADCDGVAAEWIKVPQTQADRVLFYFHGGSFAFRFPNAHAAFAARLCRRLGARALIPDYRLAPEHQFPAAADDCLAAYRWLLASGCDAGRVAFVGDSAGGNLALVTLHRIRQAGERLPACAVLLSPAVDCTLSSNSVADNQGRDPMLRLSDLIVLRHHYVPSPDMYTHPEVSPLFADFQGFPPLFLQAGSTELLRDEAVRTAHKAHAAGVDVELEVWPDAMHAFQFASFLPESALAMERIAAFVEARTGWVRAKAAAG